MQCRRRDTPGRVIRWARRGAGPHGMRVRCASSPAVALLVLAVLGGCAGDGPTPAEPAPRIEASQAMRMAEAVRAGGDDTGAAVFYGRAHALAPEEPEPLVGLAETAAARGAHDAAAGFFRKALALDPRNAVARLGYGRTLLALGRTGLARQELQAAIDADPADPRAHLTLGVVHELEGEGAEARRAYQSGLEQDPDHVPLRNNLALSLALAGRTDEAIDILGQLVRGQAGGERVRRNLALAHALAGRLDDAAAIAAHDLRGPALQRTLTFFRALRELDGRRLAEAVMCGCTPPAVTPSETEPLPPDRRLQATLVRTDGSRRERGGTAEDDRTAMTGPR